jgi:hypothetical protein
MPNNLLLIYLTTIYLCCIYLKPVFGINVNIEEYKKYFVTWEDMDVINVGIPDPTADMIA